MDSNQSASNKEDFDVNILQTQGDQNVQSSSKGEGGASMENFQEEINPLKIGSILEKVFSNLDVDSIKNARQVNPLWSIEGAKMLITKSYLKIPSDLQTEPKNSKVMNDFKAFLSHKSSDHCMIPNITIDKKSDVKLWKSFGVLGQQVESLKLNIEDYGTGWEMLQNLLVLLPNLKYLKHKNLYMTKYKGIIKALTSAMSSAQKNQSPLVISNMYLDVKTLEDLENIEKFADCNNILIEELTCNVSHLHYHRAPNLWVRVSNFMNKLLSRSRNILKSLSLVNCLSFLHLLQFPCMPALTNFELFSAVDRVDPLQPFKFSPTFRFSEKFPNLIRFEFIRNDFRDASVGVPRDELFMHLFEQTGTAPSVKILKCHYNLEIDIDPLFLTFPNVEEYKTTRLTFPRKMFESIWKYGANLRKLTINIENKSNNPVDLADLDSLITGFTQDAVDKIKETPNLAPYPLEEMEQLRVNPSILNLKRLELLEISFRGLVKNDMPDMLLAMVEEYAFKLMPKDSKFLFTLSVGSWDVEVQRVLYWMNMDKLSLVKTIEEEN